RSCKAATAQVALSWSSPYVRSQTVPSVATSRRSTVAGWSDRRWPNACNTDAKPYLAQLTSESHDLDHWLSSTETGITALLYVSLGVDPDSVGKVTRWLARLSGLRRGCQSTSRRLGAVVPQSDRWRVAVLLGAARFTVAIVGSGVQRH